jgi:hypothetical protein
MMRSMMDESGSRRKARSDEKPPVVIQLDMVTVISRLSTDICNSKMKQRAERKNEIRTVAQAI